MKQRDFRKNKDIGFPFYYFIISVYPVVFNLGHNIHEVYPNVAIRPFLILFGLSLIAFAILLLFTKSMTKSGMFGTWLMVLFLTYGSFFRWIDQISFFEMVSRHRYVLIFWLLIALIGIFLLSKVNPSKNFVRILNAFAIALILIPIIQIGSYNFRIAVQKRKADNQISETTSLLASSEKPDVYVIVLDTYPRADSLEKTFNISNQDFISQLTDMGFYVAPCSRCNYAYTELSLSSMFNLDYLDQVAPEVIKSGQDTVPLFNLLKNSLMRRNFEQLGYNTYSIASYPPLAWEDADFFYNSNSIDIDKKEDRSFLTSFERMIFESTALKTFLDLNVFTDSTEQIPVNYYRYAEHVQKHLFTLDALKNVVTKRGPKLVFTHITSPHAPFVFTPDGDLLDNPPNIPWVEGLPWEEHKKYFGMQVQYISNEMIPIIREIIESSETKPIIVLIGDHGYAADAERMAVLTAVYAPDKVKDSMYPGISLVNIFRIIFNQSFGGNYKILDDISYMSPHTDPFNFTIVEEILPGCIQ